MRQCAYCGSLLNCGAVCSCVKAVYPLIQLTRRQNYTTTGGTPAEELALFNYKLNEAEQEIKRLREENERLKKQQIPLCAICEGLLADEATKALKLPSWEDRIKKAEEKGAEGACCEFVFKLQEDRHFFLGKNINQICDIVMKAWRERR